MIPAWAYQPPRRSADFPALRYYRSADWNHILPAPTSTFGHPRIVLVRNGDQLGARLQIYLDGAYADASLDAPAMLALRDALNDALTDVAAVEADALEAERLRLIADIEATAVAPGA